MTKPLMKGVVHGRTIELESDSGLPEGQVVSVVVEPITAGNGLSSVLPTAPDS